MSETVNEKIPVLINVMTATIAIGQLSREKTKMEIASIERK